MMVVEEAVNVDGAEQELRIEKEGFRSLDGAGLGSFAKDFAPENVDDLKCVDGTGQEDLCVSKEELRTVDGAELDCCAKDCAPETCIVVRSVEMMEIEKPRNVDDSKRDRQWVVDAATELEEVCVKKQKVESLDGLELDCRATDQVKTCAPESVGGVKIEGCSTNREPETVKLEGCATNREPENVELECATNHAPETLNTEETECGEKEPKKLDNCDDQPNHGPETLNTEEMECGGKEPKKVNNCDDQPDVRIDVKEDDMLSEVSNPNLSPRESTSSLQTASSQGVDLLSNNQGVSGDITSFSSGNSSAEESVSEEEHNQIDALKDVAKSSVVLEIPEEFSTTGVRKITFKFSKRKEDYDNASAATALPATAADDGFCEAQTWIESDDMSVHGISRTNEAFYQHRDPFSRPANMELKMSKKVTSDALPTNVKKLLSTGILEGAKVKYISTSGKKELLGIIKDYGYLCGCSLCNFSKILSAYEFEMHAGGKTRHPNNHIYLENGKPIYRIIQELKTAPLSQLEEVVKDVAGSSVNELYLEAWKAKLLQHDEVASAYQYSHRKVSGMYHYKPSSVMEDGLYPASYSYIDNFTPNPYSSMEIAESWKHVVKKPRCNFSSSTIESKKPAEGGTKKRDNDLHRSLFMPNGLPDGTDLAYYSKGKKVLGGYKQGNGIVCSCCDTEISPSQFESHAGCAAKRQPYRHIYTSNGLTLHDIALMLANGQSIATNNSDDMCTICGDAGELICCEGCPRAFHAACLGLQCTPTSGWLCSYCRDNFVPGRRTAGDAGPIMIRLTRVVKAPESEGGGCVVCRTPDFSVSKFDDRTVMLCDQCEKEYHVGCLRESGLCDLKELPKDKWFCCNDCHKVYVVLQNCVLKGAEVIPAPAAAVVTKKHVQNCLMDTTTNDIQWRILSGKSRFTEHLPLLSNAAVIFRECFDPIVAKSGRDLIPVMVYGRNISGQEFGGMYCVVLIVKSVVVSAGLLRIFGQEVAELPLVATSRQNQGKGYFRALFGCIEILLSSMHVKTLVLPAAEEAESIWTNKLGFRKMTDERYRKYSRDFQLTIFKGTSMLEKEVQQTA
ncbi:putative glycine-rich RNA-binding protein 6, mitochondrial-like [Capsicum annuum]|nr:putative glycine-rich RNA-binding protein 6, mitochondrial-like [Capsicum annuum]